MCVQSIKVPIQKKSGNLFNDPRIINTRYVNTFCRYILKQACANYFYTWLNGFELFYSASKFALCCIKLVTVELVITWVG